MDQWLCVVVVRVACGVDWLPPALVDARADPAPASGLPGRLQSSAYLRPSSSCYSRRSQCLALSSTPRPLPCLQACASCAAACAASTASTSACDGCTRLHSRLASSGPPSLPVPLLLLGSSSARLAPAPAAPWPRCPRALPGPGSAASPAAASPPALPAGSAGPAAPLAAAPPPASPAAPASASGGSQRCRNSCSVRCRLCRSCGSARAAGSGRRARAQRPARGEAAAAAEPPGGRGRGRRCSRWRQRHARGPHLRRRLDQLLRGAAGDGAQERAVAAVALQRLVHLARLRLPGLLVQRAPPGDALLHLLRRGGGAGAGAGEGDAWRGRVRAEHMQVPQTLRRLCAQLHGPWAAGARAAARPGAAACRGPAAAPGPGKGRRAAAAAPACRQGRAAPAGSWPPGA
jgi:hypothetical protein